MAAYSALNSRSSKQSPAYKVTYNEPMNVITGETYGQARKVTPLQQMQ